VENGEVTGVRFGLEDESARLNINTLLFIDEQAAALDLAESALGGDAMAALAGAGASGGADSASGGTGGSASSGGDLANLAATGDARQLLMALPGMTEDIADAILDWIDEDDEPREYGAEIDYYAALGYAPANGPLTTIEQLLLVRGVTP